MGKNAEKARLVEDFQAATTGYLNFNPPAIKKKKKPGTWDNSTLQQIKPRKLVNSSAIEDKNKKAKQESQGG